MTSQQDNKFNILLEQLQLSEELSMQLSNGELKKVVVDQSNNAWQFYLNFPQVLDIEVFRALEEGLQHMPYAAKLFLSYVETPDLTLQVITPYLYYFASQLNGSASYLVTSLQVIQLHMDNEALYLRVGEQIQFDKWQQNVGLLRQLFSRAGFNIQIIIQSSEDVANEYQSLIEQHQETKHVPVYTSVPKTENKPKTENSAPKSAPVYRRKKASAMLEESPTKIIDIMEMQDGLVIEGYVFDVEFRKTKNGKEIMTAKITDYSDSLYIKKWCNEGEDKIKKGTWIKAVGNVVVDAYMNHQLVMNLNDYKELEPRVRKDNAETKRIELHTHTQMSQLDSVVPVKDLINQAIAWGHEAIAITDHSVVQSFPEAYMASNRNQNIKVLYGIEFNVINSDEGYPAHIEQDTPIQDTEFVVFDIETTGLSAAVDKIIEIGAIKIQGSKIIDRYQTFLNPKQKLDVKTMDLTHITQENVDTARDIPEVLKEFKEWCGEESVLVAHNAPFDVGFIRLAYETHGLGELKNDWLDTLQLSRHLYPEIKRHGLKALAKKFNVELTSHHRAVYDAEATSEIFLYMLNALADRDIKIASEINKVATKERNQEISRSYHVTAIAKNRDGLHDLFKLVSLAHTEYYVREPRIPVEILEEYRTHLLLGSSCIHNNVFDAVLNKNKEEILEVMKTYDYIEVQPPECYSHLPDIGWVPKYDTIYDIIKQIVSYAHELGKTVVATGDVHHLKRDDVIFREIYVESQAGVHPLAHREIKKIPTMHFRTTDEMLKDFEFLGAQEAFDLVVTNPKIVADQIEPIEVIKNELFTPRMENAEENVRSMTYEMAHSLYGEKLPSIVEERLEKELNSIIGHGFSVIYLISHKLVKKSLDDGYLVGSRGSVGSSLVATMMEITEVNPLAPHYRCPECQYSEFHGGEVGCGYDLPDKLCPECQAAMTKDGHDIPFETFLGFKGDKVPDIDLNFSGDYQAKAHNYTKEIFGEEYVYRAGTIGTVAEKTAFGYVRGYESDKEMHLKGAEIDRLVLGCTGVKRTTGQHPGGIIVVPDYMEVYDITAVQYPADDQKSAWKTTHFDFHAIHDNLLKLDILGHDDPTIIRMLQDLSGIDPKTIPTDDPKVYSLFQNTSALGVRPEQINSKVGTLGVPEFGTKFVRQMLEDTLPSTFSELVQISGLSHGTDVWLNNAQALIRNGTCVLKDVIGCRDDIMVYLIYQGLNDSEAFTIMESVRKGKGLNDDWEADMRENNVPEWYIDSCKKIKYMFPKAHATAYVLMAIRIAYFKVYHPVYFYATYFSIRSDDFEIETMLRGSEAIRARISEIEANGIKATTKEKNLQTVLEVALEMLERGLSFKQVDLYESHSTDFRVLDDKTLLFPFRSVDSLGDSVAQSIVEARKDAPFLSKEDFAQRVKISRTLIAKLELMGVLDDLEDQNQISLF